MTRIVCHGLELKESTRRFLERKQAFAFDRFGVSPESVDITLEDTNGPKGGDDKRCLLRVTLSRRIRIMIEETGGDLERVISRAFERARQTMSKLHYRYRAHGGHRPRHGQVASTATM